LPGTQSVHAVAPSVAIALPVEHESQLPCPIESWNLPTSQSEQSAAPAALDLPCSQSVQPVDAVDVACLPEAHVSQLVAPLASAAVPAAQSSHAL
jgi:hypothetical protein